MLKRYYARTPNGVVCHWRLKPDSAETLCRIAARPGELGNDAITASEVVSALMCVACRRLAVGMLNAGGG